jgi:hypothetical protein
MCAVLAPRYEWRGVLNADYPARRLRFFLDFDGLGNEESFRYITTQLGATQRAPTDRTAIVSVAGVEIAITLFEHGGKPFCQSNALALVKKALSESPVDVTQTFLLLVDSDTRVARNSLKMFAQRLVSTPVSLQTVRLSADAD